MSETLFLAWRIFIELSLETLSDCAYRFCGMELEETKFFLRFSHHFTAMSTVVLLVAFVQITSLLRATNTF